MSLIVKIPNSQKADHETPGTRSWPPISVQKKAAKEPAWSADRLAYMHMVSPPDRPFASCQNDQNVHLGKNSQNDPKGLVFYN